MQTLPPFKDIRDYIAGWDTLPVHEREEVRDAFSHLHQSWAQAMLVHKYGVISDSDHLDSNSRVSDR